VINYLFSQKWSPIIALKWKENEAMTSYVIENQPLYVKDVDVSGSDKMVHLQSYQKGDSVDYIECDVLTVSSEENRVLTPRVPKESSASKNEECTSLIMVNKSIDPACDQVNSKVNNDDQEKHKGTVLPPKRTRCPPQKRDKDILW
jgi:hypothetical protein